MVDTFGLGDVPIIFWIAFAFVILISAVVLILIILPLAGVNPRKILKDFTQKASGEICVTSDFRIIETNQTNPPEVIDENDRREKIHGFSLDAKNKVTLYNTNEDGKSNMFIENIDREMLQPIDSLTVLKEVPGIVMRVIADTTHIKMKQEIEVLRTKIKIMENERGAILNKGTVDKIIAVGEEMKQTRVAAYGTTKNPDRYGFGGKWNKQRRDSDNTDEEENSD